MKNDWQEDIAFTSQRKRRGFGTTSSPIHSIDVRLRVRVLWGVFVMGIALIAAKISYLQVIERGQHELTSYSNHVELKREIAPRGIVYDRAGVALVENKLVDEKVIRAYPLGPAISPILGYLAEVKSDELGCVLPNCYPALLLLVLQNRLQATYLHHVPLVVAPS